MDKGGAGNGKGCMKGKVVETVEDGIDLIGQVCMFVGEGCVVDG